MFNALRNRTVESRTWRGRSDAAIAGEVYLSLQALNQLVLFEVWARVLSCFVHTVFSNTAILPIEPSAQEVFEGQDPK